MNASRMILPAIYGGISAIFLWQLPIAILVGCWLFGLIYGDVHRRKTEEPTADQLRQRAEARHVLPVSMMGTMFAIVIVVYAVFFAAQIQSLMDAFLSFSPEGGSYSEYARRGFFELCFVSGFNLFLLLCSKGFSARRDGKEPGSLKALHGILCAETLILIASALGKMAMYISRYGLTQLRFYTQLVYGNTRNRLYCAVDFRIPAYPDGKNTDSHRDRILPASLLVQSQRADRQLQYRQMGIGHAGNA